MMKNSSVEFKKCFAAIVAIVFITHFGFGQSREALSISRETGRKSDTVIELPKFPEGNMSLEDAFTIALARNPGLDEVQARIESAEATIQRARSYLFPTVGIKAAYQMGHVEVHPDWMPQVRITQDFDQFTAGAGFKWRIFDGLQDIHYLKAAKSNLQNKEQMLNEAQRILLEQVSGAFIKAEMAVEQMRIASSNFDFNQKLRRDAKVRWQVGDIPESDVLNFELALKQAKAKYLAAQRDYGVACTVIAQLLAFDDAVLPEGSYPKASFDILLQSVPSFEEAKTTALRLRPDLKAVKSGIEAYEHQVKALKGTFLPNLELVAGINYTKQYDFGTINRDENDASVGLQTSWALFDGGRRKALVLEMQSERNALYQQQRQLIDSINSGIQQILLDLEMAREVFELQDDARKDAERIRDFVEKAYETGSTSITRLNEAQNGWIQATASASAARLQILMHWYRLESITGQILENSVPAISDQRNYN